MAHGSALYQGQDRLNAEALLQPCKRPPSFSTPARVWHHLGADDAQVASRPSILLDSGLLDSGPRTSKGKLRAQSAVDRVLVCYMLKRQCRGLRTRGWQPHSTARVRFARGCRATVSLAFHVSR